MTEANLASGRVAHTVLGPVPVEKLGVVAVHEALLSIIPGAEYAPDITIDRSEIFEIISAKLIKFREAGGGTVVDSAGMFHGRDLKLYETLARSTGVNIIASTGLGPEEMLGGYFLTPQTNPPSPWPADKFAALFSKEITEGMVVPRLERRGKAGLITTIAATSGMTATEESLFRAVARTSRDTGVAASIRFGVDAVAELKILRDEHLAGDRIIVGGLDRKDAQGAALEVARLGAYVGIDHVGTEDREGYLSETEQVNLVLELIDAGFVSRILLSSNAIGVAKGHADTQVSYDYVLTSFVPLLKAQAVTDEDINRILVENPRELLAVR